MITLGSFLGFKWCRGPTFCDSPREVDEGPVYAPPKSRRSVVDLRKVRVLVQEVLDAPLVEIAADNDEHITHGPLGFCN